MRRLLVPAVVCISLSGCAFAHLMRGIIADNNLPHMTTQMIALPDSVPDDSKPSQPFVSEIQTTQDLDTLPQLVRRFVED